MFLADDGDAVYQVPVLRRGDRLCGGFFVARIDLPFNKTTWYRATSGAGPRASKLRELALVEL